MFELVLVGMITVAHLIETVLVIENAEKPEYLSDVKALVEFGQTVMIQIATVFAVEFAG